MFRVFLVAAFMSLVLTGCAIDRTGRSGSRLLQIEVDSARDRARVLEKDLARERDRIDAMQHRASDARKRIAESGATLESFLEELMRVRGELSTAGHSADRSRQFVEDLDLRISQLELRYGRLERALLEAELVDSETLAAERSLSLAEGGDEQPGPGAIEVQRAESAQDPLASDSGIAGASSPVVSQDSASVGVEAGGPVAAKTASDRPPESADDVQGKLFQRALLLIQEQQWDAAGTALQKFIKAHPESRWRMEAEYLLGECLFQLGRYRSAVRQYQRVVDGDDEGQWAARALLRQAGCFKALSRVSEMRIFLEDLIRLYPQSPEARTA